MIPAFMTSASTDPVDVGQGGADRAQIDNVHENDVEDVPAGRRFELGLRRFRPLFVAARQVDPAELGT